MIRFLLFLGILLFLFNQPAGSLEALNPEQVVIEIDADDFYVAIGQQNIACRLYVPANDKIFALGSYVVQCKIESN